jgi:hypothetical protein
MPHNLDRTTPSTDAEGVVVSSVTRPTANLGTLSGDAMLRMANGMRAKFDEND